MPVPEVAGQVNKRVFNPLELRLGVRPVLTHVGRTSGTTYRTPLDAHPVDGGGLRVHRAKQPVKLVTLGRLNPCRMYP